MSSKRKGKRKVASGFAAGLMLAACPAILWAGEESILSKVFSSAWKGAKSVSYVAPSRADMEAMQQLFVRLLKGEPGSKMADELQKLGWTTSTETIGNVTWTIVAEAGNRREGRGLYAFSSNGRHALQAPHVPSDRFTGRILLRYAEDGLPRALAWNTVSRRTADLADLDESYLVAFSRAFAQAYPEEKIFQLHGFDPGRRRSIAAAQSSAIISPAHDKPRPELKSAVKCVQQKIDKRARLYGHDVRELGGTTNSVARILRNATYQGFVHVEMNFPLRKSLLDDPDKRRQLLACLGGGQ